MNLERRTFNGDLWPEKRVSISNKDSGHCLFVNARYAEIGESEKHADYIVNAVNHADALADALDNLIKQTVKVYSNSKALGDAENSAIAALEAYRGEK